MTVVADAPDGLVTVVVLIMSPPAVYSVSTLMIEPFSVFVSCSTMVSPVLSVSEAGRLVFELALEVEVMVAVVCCSEGGLPCSCSCSQHRLLDRSFCIRVGSHPFPAES